MTSFGNTSLEPVESDAIRKIAELAVSQDYLIENAEWWSKAFVVWMNKPLTPELKDRVIREFPDVIFEEWPGGPHDHGSRSFVDGPFALAFPWTPPSVR